MDGAKIQIMTLITCHVDTELQVRFSYCQKQFICGKSLMFKVPVSLCI